jgi:Putative threonine efflux protein
MHEQIDVIGLSLATLVFVLSPGAGVLALLAVGIRQGWKAVLWLATGLIAGDIVYLMLALFGLGLLGSMLPDVLLATRIIGAIYLVWLGVLTFRAAPPERVEKVDKRAPLKLLAGGFAISITNPKVVLFYLGFLPAFVALENMTIPLALQVLAVVVAMLYVGCGFYAFASHQVRNILTNPKRGVWVQRVSGSLMMLAAIWILLS